MSVNKVKEIQDIFSKFSKNYSVVEITVNILVIENFMASQIIQTQKLNLIILL